MTPLFDANCHPVPSGTRRQASVGFGALQDQLRAAGFIGACAVGLPDLEGYSHEAFIAETKVYPDLTPVAAWYDMPRESIMTEVHRLGALGYRFLKVHPHRCGLSVKDANYLALLRHAAACGMTVFHCSYQFGLLQDNGKHPIDPLPYLVEAISATPRLRMVLLHAGTVELLRYAEAFRAIPNVLLDLSFTLNRFAGSSLELDLAYLFRNFDRRLCLGSDFPDYTPADVRARFDQLAGDLPQEKKENIGWRNITSFLGVTPADGLSERDSAT